MGLSDSLILLFICHCLILICNCGNRLRNVTPVTYAEVPVMKKGKSLRDEDIVLEEGSKPELYTEEHEKLLGNTERSWTLFVDGVGKDGKRIYDPVSGKTCHQCRSGGFPRCRMIFPC